MQPGYDEAVRTEGGNRGGGGRSDRGEGERVSWLRRFANTFRVWTVAVVFAGIWAAASGFARSDAAPACVPAAGRGAVASKDTPELCIDGAALMRHVETLARPELKGRDTGSPEEKVAAEYIARELTDAGLMPPPDWTSPIQPFDFKGSPAHNVVVCLRGDDPVLREEWIVVGAHFDHLGERKGQVYPGADDNASGVAGVIETARALRKCAPPLKRSILFCFFTGEERGFVGSRHFLNTSPVPKSRIVAMLNADMISRDDTRTIHVVGTQTCDAFSAVVEAGAARVGLKAVFDHPEWTYQSDHYVFFSEKIPFLYFGVEDHPDYHRPTDTPEKTNRDQMERVSRLMLVVVQILADAPRRPAWREGGVEAADKPRE